MTLLAQVDALRLELLLLFLFGTYALAAIGASLDFGGSRGLRYASYRRPAFAPPPWLFGAAWSLLYTLQGIAAYLVRVSRDAPYAAAADDGTRRALVLYAVLQLVLALYSPFAANLVVAFVIVLLSAVVSVVVTIQFFGFSTAAGWLLVPLVAWLVFATILSFSLIVLNSGKRLKQVASDQSTSASMRSAREQRIAARMRSAPSSSRSHGSSDEYTAQFTGPADHSGRKKKKSQPKAY